MGPGETVAKEVTGRRARRLRGRGCHSTSRIACAAQPVTDEGGLYAPAPLVGQRRHPAEGRDTRVDAERCASEYAPVVGRVCQEQAGFIAVEGSGREGVVGAPAIRALAPPAQCGNALPGRKPLLVDEGEVDAWRGSGEVLERVDEGRRHMVGGVAELDEELDQCGLRGFGAFHCGFDADVRCHRFELVEVGRLHGSGQPDRQRAVDEQPRTQQDSDTVGKVERRRAP